MTADKRRIRVSAANLKHSHLYVTRQLLDFFPKDAVGGPRRKKRQPKMGTGSESSRCLSPFSDGHGFDLILDGLGKTVHTDIASDAKSGRTRFIRCRGEIGEFFKHHEVKAGGYVEVRRLAEKKYQLGLPRPRAAEFFAGIGLVRLALERQGWDVVFANDIDPDKVEMYRHNWPKDDHLVLA